MRKRRESARKREDEVRAASAAETEHEGTTDQSTGLEDDGFVFWPTSLGDPAGPRLVQVERRPPREPEKASPPRRRMATTVLFTFLFFAGAALTAAAGNEVATIVSSSSDVAAVETQTTDTTATEATTTTETTTTETTTTVTTTEESSTTTTTSSSEPDPSAPAPGTGETTTDATTTAAAPVENQPSGGGVETPQTTTTTTEPGAPASSPASEPATSTVVDDSQNAPAAAASTQPEAKPAPLLEPRPAAKSSGHKRVKRDIGYASLNEAPKPSEIEPEGDSSTPAGNVSWIDEPLPDPTPASLRLTHEFAQQLRAASSAEGLDWAFLLAVLRAEQLDSSGQVSPSALQEKAAVLGPLHVRAGDRKAVLAYNPSGLFARRVLVLEHYYKALGLNALVNGLADSRDSLAAKILADQRIEIYPGGREDISTGRVDVRVVAMIAFLAESFGDVRVSCLISGHRLFARPGVISAHIYGRGLDIGALDGVSIYGNQQPRSVTARAVTQILLLPAEVLPRQVISLLGFGGPSFPLADHDDHIHIGY